MRGRPFGNLTFEMHFCSGNQAKFPGKPGMSGLLAIDEGVVDIVVFVRQYFGFAECSNESWYDRDSLGPIF